MSSATSLVAKIDALKKLQGRLKNEQEARRVLRDLKGARDRCLASTFGRQRDLVLSDDLRIVNYSGRRAGKTDGWAAKFYLTGTKPGAENGLSVFFTSSLARSEKLIGTAFRLFNERHRLGISRISRDSEVYYRFPNNHRVWVTGVKDKSEVDKFRGPKYHAAVGDECQGLTAFLDFLVVDAIEPALMDYNGWLGLSGTPGVQPVGDWHEFCTNGQFSSYHWDCRDNPYLDELLKKSGVTGGVVEWLQKMMEGHHWDWDTPRFVREYLGLWCSDKSSLCYPYDRTINWVPVLPEGDWRYAIGVDFGVNDPCAWVVVAYRHGCSKVYVVHAETSENTSPSAAAIITLRLKKQFGADIIVADKGGIGAAFIREWIQKYQLPAVAAKKVDVAGQIAIMAGELASGSIVIVGDQPQGLADEWAVLPWDDDMTGHHDRYPDHLSDAARYIIRFLSKGEDEALRPPPAPPKDPEREARLQMERDLAARGWGR